MHGCCVQKPRVSVSVPKPTDFRTTLTEKTAETQVLVWTLRYPGLG